MPRVSLIVLRSPEIPWPSDRMAEFRAALEGSGFSAEVLDVTDPSARPSGLDVDTQCRSIVAKGPGLAESAVAGLRAADGEFLVVLDLAMQYTPEQVLSVARRLDSGQADLAIATRRRIVSGPISLRLFGTTDPTSGLVGLTRTAAAAADGSLAPIGSQFVLELLTRVDGARVDVPVKSVATTSRAATPWGDVRQFKRLADYRFGNASRLLQFCFVGASGMVVDLTCYALFQAILARTSLMEGMTAPIVGGPLALATAAVLSIAIALTWNFTINRRLTFNDARGGSIGRQFLRYVLSNMLGIGVSLTLRLLLPNSIGFFRQHRLAAAVVGIVAATGISFSMARWFVFGQKAKAEEGRRPPRRRFFSVFRGEPGVGKAMAPNPHLEGSPTSSR